MSSSSSEQKENNNKAHVRVTDLVTPCLLLDISRVKQNINRLQNHLNSLQQQVVFRPHGKTAKNDQIMKMITTTTTTSDTKLINHNDNNTKTTNESSSSSSPSPGPICVSTIKEAEYYVEQGFTDVTYAVGMAVNKLPRLSTLLNNQANVTVILDSIEQAEMLNTRAQQLNVKNVNVLIEIDCDGHRSGVQPGSSLLPQLGHVIHNSPNLTLQGILTHAGESYSSQDEEDLRRFAKQEVDLAVQCAAELRADNLPCDVVSIGSTPTAHFVQDLTGITEVRAGVYVFFDLVMMNLGVCREEDIALSVLVTVIGHQKDKGWVVTDGGWMALSRDRGTANQKVDYNYGKVCDVKGVSIEGVTVSMTNQEHGVLSAGEGVILDWSQFEIGTQLRILPNHACATAGMHDRYHILERNDSEEIVDVWPRISGW